MSQKVVHQLQVVRVEWSVLQHSGEAWLFGYQADPKTQNVYTDTDWAADALTGKSVSCTLERYGSHILDCSVREAIAGCTVFRRGRVSRQSRAVECHRENSTICRFLPFRFLKHSVVFNCACDARACVVLHIDASPMMFLNSGDERCDVLIFQ